MELRVTTAEGSQPIRQTALRNFPRFSSAPTIDDRVARDASFDAMLVEVSQLTLPPFGDPNAARLPLVTKLRTDVPTPRISPSH
jgi:hypothetical protein